jgi:xylulokinase
MLAGVGVGLFPSYREVIDRTIATRRVHEAKTEDQEAYERGYRTYRALYENLQDLMHNR